MAPLRIIKRLHHNHTSMSMMEGSTIDFCLELQAKEIINTFKELLEKSAKRETRGHWRGIKHQLFLHNLVIDESTFGNATFHNGECLWKTIKIQAEKEGLVHMPENLYVLRNLVAARLSQNKAEICSFGITPEDFEAQLPKIREGHEWEFPLFDAAPLAIAQLLGIHLIIIRDDMDPLHLNEGGEKVVIVAYHSRSSYDPVNVIEGATSKTGEKYKAKQVITQVPQVTQLVSISIAGLYSYALPHHFSFHNNKLLLTGPNNGGKSNVSRAIAFGLANFPNTPNEQVFDEIKYSGPVQPGNYFLALQFALDEKTALALASFIVYGHMGVYFYQSEEKEGINTIVADVAKRLASLQLVYRRQAGYLQPLVLCRSVYSSVVYEDNPRSEDILVFDSHNFESYINANVKFHQDLVLKIEQALGVQSVRHNGSWWPRVKNFKHSKLIQSLCTKFVGNNWEHDTSPPLRDLIANILRDSVAFLPQDRGSFSKDRHPKPLHIFTVDHAMKVLANSNESFIHQMKNIGVNVILPLRTSEAIKIFKESASDNKTEWLRLLNDDDVVTARLKGLLYIGVEKQDIIKVLGDTSGVPDYPQYLTKLRSTLGNLIGRDVKIEDTFARQDSISATKYHSTPEHLQALGVYFTLTDNDSKDLSLGALYGAAQQFFVIYCSLFLSNFGTVVLDEPEVSLHFTSRVRLQRLLRSLPEVSVVISTHAEEFITEEWFPALYHCSRINASTQAKSYTAEIMTVFKEMAPLRAVATETRSLFFANKVLFVEGAHDSRLCETLINLAMKNPYIQELFARHNIELERLSSWTVVSLASCSNAPMICKLAVQLGLYWAVVFDNDALVHKNADTLKKMFSKRPATCVIELMEEKEEFGRLIERPPLTDAELEMNKEMENLEDPNEKKQLKNQFQEKILQQKQDNVKQFVATIPRIFCWPGEMEEVFWATPVAVDVLWDNSTKRPTMPKAKKQKIDSSKCRKCKVKLEDAWKYCATCGTKKPSDSEAAQPTLEVLKREWICNKYSANSLHDTWSNIPLSALEEALFLLLLNENEEFLKFCKFLSQ